MTKKLLFFFIFLSSTIFSQSGYKVKFLFAYDFPNRHQIGIKLLGDKPLSFTLKAGYKLPFPSGADYDDVIGIWGLIGPIGSIGTELNFKNPYHKISLEYEYSELVGSYQTPQHFNVGRDYFVTRYNIWTYSNLLLLGYNFHVRSNPNFSFNLKLGGGLRQIKKEVYFYGSRMPSAKNQLKETKVDHFNEPTYSIRVGVSYCFGHTKLIKPRHQELKNEITVYFKNKDSIVNSLFENYQYSQDAYDEYNSIHKRFLKRLNKYSNSNDTLKLYEKFDHIKNRIDKELYYKTMKPDAYKKTKTTASGKIKIIHIKPDYYNLRKRKQFKELYEKNRIN